METKENCNLVGVWRAIIRDAKTGEIVRDFEFKNLLPTIGRTAIAAQIADDYTNAAKITYIALGSGTTPPTNANTTLEAETTRKIVASNSHVNNEGSVAVFFAAGEATGTHREVGAFGDGIATTASASADSGILFSRTATTITVSATETLTLTYRLTVN